jgi:hypothetical protein
MVKQARKTKHGKLRKIGKQARPKPTRMAKTRTTKPRVRKLRGGVEGIRSFAGRWSKKQEPSQAIKDQYANWRHETHRLQAALDSAPASQTAKLQGRINGLVAMMQHYQDKYNI